MVCYGDVSDYLAAGIIVQSAINNFGRLDFLVNNAAGLGSGTLVDTSEADWDYQTSAKLKGSFNCMRHALPHMIAQRFGRIVNVASWAWIGLAGLSAHSAANAGRVGLTKAASKELFNLGVTVNAIFPEAASPGHITEFAAMKEKLQALGVTIDQEKLQEVEEAHGPAENLGPFVGYLLTDAAANISGAVFAVTAGGQVTLFSDPAPSKTILKEGSPWTLEELRKAVPQRLLKDYVPVASVNDHGQERDSAK